MYVEIWRYGDSFFSKERIKGVGKDCLLFAHLPSFLMKGVWGSLNRPSLGMTTQLLLDVEASVERGSMTDHTPQKKLQNFF